MLSMLSPILLFEVRVRKLKFSEAFQKVVIKQHIRVNDIYKLE